MAQKRYISTSFWDDSWVIELEPKQKFLYMYLLTNTLTEISGVYKISKRRIQFDTGLTLSEITTSLELFECNKKAILFGEYMILPKWPKHQDGDKNVKVKKGIENLLKSLSGEVLAKLIEVDYSWDKEQLKTLLKLTGYPMDSLSIAHEYPIDNPSIEHVYPIDSPTYPMDSLRTIKSKSKSKSQSQRKGNFVSETEPQLQNASDSGSCEQISEEEENLMLVVGPFKNLKISSVQLNNLEKLYSRDVVLQYVSQVSTSLQRGTLNAVNSTYSIVNSFIVKDLKSHKIALPDGYASPFSKPLQKQTPPRPVKCKKCGSKLDFMGRCLKCKIAVEINPSKNKWEWIQLADKSSLENVNNWKKKQMGELN